MSALSARRSRGLLRGQKPEEGIPSAADISGNFCRLQSNWEAVRWWPLVARDKYKGALVPVLLEALAWARFFLGAGLPSSFMRMKTRYTLRQAATPIAAPMERHKRGCRNR